MSGQRKSLAAFHESARKAPNATARRDVILEMDAEHGWAAATATLGWHWPTGKRLVDGLLARLVASASRAAGVSIHAARALVAAALMNGTERHAYGQLNPTKKLAVYRLGDFSRYTGWYQWRDDAEAAWTHHKPATLIYTATVRLGEVLATKMTGAHLEIILVPKFCPMFRREFLPAAFRSSKGSP